MTDDERRAANRAKYPALADLIDKVREHFPDAGVTRITPVTKERQTEWLAMKADAKKRAAIRAAGGPTGGVWTGTPADDHFSMFE
jgi:hypothetical protein